MKKIHAHNLLNQPLTNINIFSKHPQLQKLVMHIDKQLFMRRRNKNSILTFIPIGEYRNLMVKFLLCVLNAMSVGKLWNQWMITAGTLRRSMVVKIAEF